MYNEKRYKTGPSCFWPQASTCCHSSQMSHPLVLCFDLYSSLKMSKQHQSLMENSQNVYSSTISLKTTLFRGHPCILFQNAVEMQYFTTDKSHCYL